MAPVRVPDRTTRESVMKILVLTGAGISAENGLCAFRDKGGLWSQFDPMKLATPEAFRQRPGAGSRLLQFPPPERPRCAAQPRPFRARPAGRGTRRARRRADARHPEHRRSARARRHQPRHPHARRTPESALRALRGRPSLAAGPGRVGSLPRLRPNWPHASARRLVRRDPARDGRDPVQAPLGRSVRRHRHVRRAPLKSGPAFRCLPPHGPAECRLEWRPLPDAPSGRG